MIYLLAHIGNVSILAMLEREVEGIFGWLFGSFVNPTSPIAIEPSSD